MTEAWSGVGLMAVAFIVNWGFSKAKQSDHERRLTDLETKHDKQVEFVHGLRDVYVSNQHFNDIMKEIRETQREMKEDLRRVLELLADRA